VNTPWGDLTVSDAHVHFFSHRFYASLAKQKGLADADALGPLLSWEIPREDPEALAHRWIGELDAKGVKRACVIASVPGDEGSVARAVSAYPDRFLGHFLLDPTQPDAVERIAKCAADPHLHCVCLFPAMQRYSLHDAAVSAVLEAAGRLAVFVHCGALSVGVRKKLGLPCPFDLRFSNPLHVHALAMRFPQTRFIVPHFGAGMFREALMLADLCPNVYLDSSSTNSWMRYEGLTLTEVFRRTIAVSGPERILFGTDSSFFPRGWHGAVFDQQVAALHSLGIKPAQAAQILSGNLENFYGVAAGA
jgi:predicted TIM-barrel fold metal-dependent hydrolase